MQFNNILLPPFVIAGLYKHSLVLLDEEMLGANNRLPMSHEQLISREQSALNNEQLKISNEQSALSNKHEEKSNIKEEPLLKTNNQSVKREVDANTIVETEQTTKTLESLRKKELSTVNHQPSTIKYLGGFGKKISIVLEDHFQPHINDGDLAFLTKLLQACQLSLSDVAIINVVSNQAFSNQLWQLMPAEKMIIFEVDLGTLGLPFRMPHFRLQPWSDCVFLASPSLETLQNVASEETVQLKRKLWENLKKCFCHNKIFTHLTKYLPS